MLSNLIKGNFILCFKDFIIFEVKTFDVFCRAVLKRSENLRLQEIVTTYREPSAGQLVVVIVDGGAESEPPHA